MQRSARPSDWMQILAEVRTAHALHRPQVREIGPDSRDRDQNQHAAAEQIVWARKQLRAANWKPAAAAFAKAEELAPGGLDAALGLQLARRKLTPDDGSDEAQPVVLRSPRARRDISRRARDAPPVDGRTAAWRVRSLHLLGLRRLARDIADQAIGQHDDCGALHRIYGQLAIDAEMWEEAADAFARATAINPEDAASAVYQARTLRQLGRLGDARSVLDVSLRCAHDAALYNEVGQIERVEGRFEEANAAFLAADELDPGDVASAVGRVRLARDLGNISDAMRIVTNALMQHPDAVSLLVAAGEVAFDAHDHERAFSYYMRALELDIRRPGQGLNPPLVAQTLRARRRRGSLRPLVPICRALDRRIRRFRREHEWPHILRIIRELLAHDPPCFGRIRDVMESFSWMESRLLVIEGLVLRSVEAFWILCSVVLASALPIFIEPSPALPLELLGALLAYVVLSLLAFRVAFAGGIGYGAGVAITYAGLAAVVLAVGQHLPVAVSYAVACALLLTSIVVSGLVATGGFVLGVTQMIERRQVRREPLGAALVSLASVLERLQRTPLGAGKPESNLMAIETAATAVRWYMRGSGASGDRRTDAWRHERADGVAAAMRELKMWVLVPGSDTQERLHERIGRDVASIAEGRWHDVPWVNAGPGTARRRRRLAVVVMRNIVIAAIPLGGLLGVQASGVLALDSQTRKSALFASGAWALVTLVMTFDPDFAARLDAAKGLLRMSKPDSRG